MVDVRSLTGARPTGGRRQQVVSGMVSTEQPAPASVSDPVYVVIPSHSSELSYPLPWPVLYGATLPAQGAKVLVGYDENNAPSVVSWAGAYSSSEIITPPPSGGDDTDMLLDFCASGRSVRMQPGTYNVSGLAFGALTNFALGGSGKGITNLNCTGSSAGVSIGTTSGALVSNANIALADFTILGNSSMTEGVNLSRFQGFRCDNVDVTGVSGTGAAAWRFEAVNSGKLINCDGRQSGVGALFTDDVHADSGANLIDWDGGQITGNTTAIQGINAYTLGGGDGNSFRNVNIASTIQAPAVLLVGVGWHWDKCWFENNAAGTCVIQLGNPTAGTYSEHATFDRCLFYETNAITYGIQATSKSIGFDVLHTRQESTVFTAFVRTESGSSQGVMGPNWTTGAVPMLSDGAGTTVTYG